MMNRKYNSLLQHLPLKLTEEEQLLHHTAPLLRKAGHLGVHRLKIREKYRKRTYGQSLQQP